MKMRWCVAAVIVCVAVLFYCADNRPDPTLAEKLVIYLYPGQTQEVSVRLDYDGRLTDVTPAYGDGWKVTAWSDGRLVDHNDGKEYPYLFWEGEDRIAYDTTRGFVVSGSGTETFLGEKLEHLGLKEKEHEAFIEYWLPRMEGNPYNLIIFQKEAYEETAGFLISSKPDSILRVFMAYMPLEQPVQAEEPELALLECRGFTVVEWGGRGILAE